MTQSIRLGIPQDDSSLDWARAWAVLDHQFPPRSVTVDRVDEDDGREQPTGPGFLTFVSDHTIALHGLHRGPAPPGYISLNPPTVPRLVRPEQAEPANARENFDSDPQLVDEGENNYYDWDDDDDDDDDDLPALETDWRALNSSWLTHGGVPAETLATLPIVAAAAVDALTLTCAICQNDAVEGEMFRTLPCAHRFHVEEIDVWFAAHRTCPLCKAVVTGQRNQQHEPDAEDSGQAALWADDAYWAQSPHPNARFGELGLRGGLGAIMMHLDHEPHLLHRDLSVRGVLFPDFGRRLQASAEHEADQADAVDESGMNTRDIELVMSQCDVSRAVVWISIVSCIRIRIYIYIYIYILYIYILQS